MGDAFVGNLPGSMGEVSTLLIALTGLVLIFMKIASWRIVAGVLVGLIGASLLLNAIGSDSNPMFSMPFYWHFVIGGGCVWYLLHGDRPCLGSFYQ